MIVYIWLPYMTTVYDAHIWQAHMTIICDYNIWCSYMITVYDHCIWQHAHAHAHIWQCWYMIVWQNVRIWLSVYDSVYDSSKNCHIWTFHGCHICSSYMTTHIVIYERSYMIVIYDKILAWVMSHMYCHIRSKCSYMTSGILFAYDRKPVYDSHIWQLPYMTVIYDRVSPWDDPQEIIRMFLRVTQNYPGIS